MTEKKSFFIDKVIAEKYRIVQEMERSPMARIFFGYDVSNSEIVTIKILDTTKMNNPEYIKRFFWEAKILKKVRHPNVIKLLDQGEINGMNYIVTEQVKGKNLSTYLNMKKSLSLEHLIGIMIQVGMVLDTIHNENIIHRNLNPEDIMVIDPETAKIKVSGFDIARESQGQYQTQTSFKQNNDYSSPEQIFGSEIDCTTDIYSMGAILYQIVTGEVPTLQAVDEELAPASKKAKVPPELDSIISRCLKLEKVERFPSAYDLNISLQRFRDNYFAAQAAERAYAKDSIGLLLNDLSKTLGSDVKKDCEAAIEKLLDINDPRAFKLIYHALGNKFWSVRKVAAEALIKVGQSVLPLIKANVDFKNIDQAYWTVKILEKMGGEEAEFLLGEFLKHSNQDIVNFAIEAIGNINSYTNIPNLIRFFDSKFWLIRQEAAAVVKKFGENSMKELESALQNGNNNTKFWTVNCIAHIKGNKAPGYLKTLYEEGDEDLKTYVVLAMKEIDHTRVDDFLVERLGKESWALNQQIVDVLSTKGKYVAHKLSKLVNSDEQGELRYNAIKITTRILGMDSLSILEGLLLDDDTKIRAFAVRALGEIQCVDSIKILIDFFEDDSWVIRKLASDSLAKIGDLAIPHLDEPLRSANPDVRYWAIQTLGAIGKQAILPLMRVFTNGSSADRLQVIPVLGLTKDIRIIQLFVKALEDEKWVVRNVAANTMILMGPMVIVPLLKIIVGKSKDKCFWARKILLNFEDEVLKKLTPMLMNNNDQQKRIAVMALLQLATEKSSKLIINIIKKGGKPLRDIVLNSMIKSGDTKSVVMIIDLLEAGPIKEKLVEILNHLIAEH